MKCCDDFEVYYCDNTLMRKQFKQMKLCSRPSIFVNDRKLRRKLTTLLRIL